jgi:uncharacterized protein (DUF1697 family)
MAELRECIAEAGHDDVSTYIASGDVLLSSPVRSAAQLEQPAHRPRAGEARRLVTAFTAD